MKQENIMLPATVLLGLTLAGCSGGLDKLSVRAVQPESMAVSGTAGDLVAAGRRMLADGHYGLAISQFRVALQTDEGSAEAHNGLAVAYALLGRPDLARRHFELAALNDPLNAAYRRNLARLEGSGQARAEALAGKVDEVPAVVENHIDAAAEKALRIVSLSSGSAMLVTRPGGKAPVAAPAPKAVIRVVRQDERGKGPVLERTSGRMVMLRTNGAAEKVAALGKGQANTPSTRAVASAMPPRPARSITVPIVRRTASAEGCAGSAPTASQNRPVAVRVVKCPV